MTVTVHQLPIGIDWLRRVRCADFENSRVFELVDDIAGIAAIDVNVANFADEGDQMISIHLHRSSGRGCFGVAFERRQRFHREVFGCRGRSTCDGADSGRCCARGIGDAGRDEGNHAEDAAPCVGGFHRWGARVSVGIVTDEFSGLRLKCRHYLLVTVG